MLSLHDMVNNRYELDDPVVKSFDITLDKEGYRVVRCRGCGRIVRVSECWTYGGLNGLLNTGICYDCR